MALRFQGVDFYDADGLLTEEERAVRDTVRAWVDDNVIPVIGEHYVAGKFPAHLVPQMAELGDRKSTRLNSSHGYISYAVFCLKKKKLSSHDTHGNQSK